MCLTVINLPTFRVHMTHSPSSPRCLPERVAKGSQGLKKGKAWQGKGKEVTAPANMSSLE